MSLLTAITNYLNQGPNRIIKHGNMPPHHPVRTVQDGAEVHLDQVTLTLTGHAPNQYSALLSGGTYNNVTVNNLDPIGLATEIGSNSFSGDYAEIWSHTPFQRFYRVERRPFQVLHDNGIRFFGNFLLSSPCMICGICLPTSNMHIDHQRPQANGRLQAVVKTMRAFGFTVDGAKGEKGQNWRNPQYRILNSREGRRLNRMQVDGDALHNSDLDARKRRYTLTDEGTIYYSLFIAAGGAVSLEEECLHSFFNLRPLCVSCNTSLGANGLRRFV